MEYEKQQKANTIDNNDNKYNIGNNNFNKSTKKAKTLEVERQLDK